jgi:hypothetical protein
MRCRSLNVYYTVWNLYLESKLVNDGSYCSGECSKLTRFLFFFFAVTLFTYWREKFPFCSLKYIFFSMARQPYMGLGLLISSRFHDHTL